MIITTICDVFRNVDDVHSLLDDIAEQQGVASEITEALSNPVGFSQDVDDVSDAHSNPLYFNLSMLQFK
jgi:Snf7